MTIKRHLTETRFSEAVISSDLIFLSGQVPTNIHDDIKAQTANVLAQIDTLLHDLGSDKTRLIDATIFLKDFIDYDEMNEVWDRWLPEGYAPCRACVQANLAKPEWKLEIKIIAKTK
ncbi:RidA family protein [Neisseria sp. Ec49-e6-T10]|uniref:RidA family protein n=1 Tax=Neisseria sp. Ec49-e6-T10 TaxID=3140744 RepID=UPI003EB6C95C